MKKKPSIALYLSMILSLIGCSIDVSQPTQATSIPNSGFVDSTPAIDSNNATSPASGSTRPITWAGLNLSGRLVYSRVSSNNDVSALSVETLNLTTGEIKAIFIAPDDAWVYYTTVSADGKQLIMSYVPPSQSGPSGNQALYILPLDGSAAPQFLVMPPTEYDQYIQVEWSPDGKYIYYIHSNYNDQPEGQIFPNYEIFRMTYPDGQPEKIAEHAFWPRVSSDSSKLVYVTLDPVTGGNELFVADADGGNTRQIELSGETVPGIKDAPLFSPDGQSIFFSAPSPTQSYQPNWLDKLMGVQIAKAHNLPSDWWTVPVSGGEPTQLTHIQSAGLFGSISPDQKHLVSFSQDGLFVMDLDGSNLTMLIPDPGGSTVNWIP